MSSSINLVSTKNDQLEKELKRLRLFRIIAVISLILVASVSVIIFVINITLPIPAIKKNQEQALSGISLLREKLVKNFLINDRVRNISEIISKRKNYSSTLENLLSKVSADLSVDTFEVEGKIVSISISGDSLIPINNFLNNIIELGNKGKIIKNVLIESLTLNSTNGKYTLSMKADIP